MSDLAHHYIPKACSMPSTEEPHKKGLIND